jgi:hypothetical protein
MSRYPVESDSGAAFDRVSYREALAGPGNDTRLWLALGVVSEASDTVQPVSFTDTNGGPLPYPVVSVDLALSGSRLPCRVASFSAGSGEATWSPFVSGDEVIVGIPQGDERHGPVILGRFNQQRDSFPASVGGMDPTQNNLGFRRVITPYILESAASIQFRQSPTTAAFGLDKTGYAFMLNGDGHALHVGSDWLGLMTFDTTGNIKIIPASGSNDTQAYLNGGACELLLDDQAAHLLTKGTLTIQTSATPVGALGHALTLEQVLVLLQAIVTELGPLFTVPLTPPAIAAIMAAAIPAAAVLPITPMTAPIQVALAVPPDPTGVTPGVGRPGFIL